MSSFAVPHAISPVAGGSTAGGSARLGDLDPWRPSAGDPWDRRKAAHLARRAGFGARPEELDALVLLGVDKVIDLLLVPAPTALQESGVAVLPNGEILNLTSSLTAQRAQWLWEMVNGTNWLREKMCLFWADHFSVGSAETAADPTLPAHINLFRRLGLGSFRTLLLEVTKDPAMLYWLDNYLNGVPRSGVQTINENYGRELLELYTMGVLGGYTQNDVVEASKCLSGWTLLGRNTSYYRASYHVAGPKTVLGTVINNVDGSRDLDSLLDVLLAWPATARYMVEKFWRWFVNDTPAAATLDTLAQRWRTEGYDVRSLLNVLLRCRAFFSSASMRKLVKSPAEIVAGAIRTTATPINAYQTLAARVEQMGLPLLRYTNPSGLTEGIAWIDSQSVITRANFADDLTQTSTTSGFRPVFDPFREVNRLGLTTAQQIVDHYLDFLVDGDVPVAVRTNLYNFMNNNDAGPAPFTGTSTQINQKVRGLVHLIMSLPEYQMN
jgi:uncharacterized protein (DUF1800 family)